MSTKEKFKKQNEEKKRQLISLIEKTKIGQKHRFIKVQGDVQKQLNQEKGMDTNTVSNKTSKNSRAPLSFNPHPEKQVKAANVLLKSFGVQLRAEDKIIQLNSDLDMSGDNNNSNESLTNKKQKVKIKKMNNLPKVIKDKIQDDPFFVNLNQGSETEKIQTIQRLNMSKYTCSA